jgi:broad specificity phosphatase PhoE
VTVRVQLFVPAVTPGAREGLFGAGDGLDQAGRERVIRSARTWPKELRATCAPEPACVETAALLGLDAAVDGDLHDWDLGAWAGKSLAQVAQESPAALERWATDPDFAAHSGESLQHLRSRVTKWLDRLEGEAHPRLVTVAPAAVVRAVLLSVLDAPPATFWRLDLEPLTSVHVSLRPGRRAIRWSAA